MLGNDGKLLSAAFRIEMSRSKINQLSLLILLLGFGSALMIYALARPADDDALLDDPFGRKKYLREMEVYGGKANVVSAQFMAWFGGLWHGENLAGTVAVLTVGATLIFRFIAIPPPIPPAPANRKRPSPPPS